MSYFTPDVIAREQLPGAWSTSEAAPPTGSGGLLDPYWRKKKKKKQEELFILVKELLEVFV